MVNKELIKQLEEEKAKLLKERPDLQPFQDKLDRMLSRLPDQKSRMLLTFNMLQEHTAKLGEAMRELSDIITEAIERAKNE